MSERPPFSRRNLPPPPGPGRARDAAAAVEWAAGSGAAGEVIGGVTAMLRQRQRRRRMVLGGIAVVALGAGLAWRFAPPAAMPSPAPSSIAIATPAQRLLDDGSRVELADGAELDVLFSPQERRVVLRRGTAYFAVRRDAARPFVVVARGIETRALGTAFTVQVGATSVDVIVTEGRVSVGAEPAADATPSVPEPARAVAAAGERVVYSLAAATAAVAPVSPPELATELAWRAPRLEFSAAPLAEVVARFNAYAATPVELGAPELGRLKISGVLRADNRDGLLRLLEIQFGLRSEARADGTVVVLPATR